MDLFSELPTMSLYLKKHRHNPSGIIGDSVLLSGIKLFGIQEIYFKICKVGL